MNSPTQTQAGTPQPGLLTSFLFPLRSAGSSIRERTCPSAPREGLLLPRGGLRTRPISPGGEGEFHT